MLVLPGEAKPGPAGDEDAEVRGRAEQIGHERGGVEDVLEVVQHEQQLPVAHERLKPGHERFLARFAQAEELRDGWRDKIGMRDRGEADEAGAIREILGKPGSDGQGQPGLAHAARSGQGQQPDIRAAHAGDEIGNFVLPAHQRREGKGEWQRIGTAYDVDHGRPNR